MTEPLIVTCLTADIVRIRVPQGVKVQVEFIEPLNPIPRVKSLLPDNIPKYEPLISVPFA